MSWLGAAIGAVGSLFGAKMGADAQEDNMQAQIAWQREQLQNKHQWEVEDLKKAGLNPILSANGASSAASVNPGALVNPLSGLSSSAAELGKLKSEIKMNEASVENQTKQADASMKQADSSMMNAESNKLATDTQVIKTQADIANANASTAASVAKMQSDAQAYQNYVNGMVANGAAMANAAASQADAAWHSATANSARQFKDIEKIEQEMKIRVPQLESALYHSKNRKDHQNYYGLLDQTKQLLDVINPFSAIRFGGH